MTLTKNQLKVAGLLAIGEHTDAEIAVEVGVTDRTIRNWKRKPEIQEKTARLKEAILAETERQIISQGFARKAQRIKRYNDRLELLDQVREERAADPAMADIPGGTTGLIVKTLKSVGFGENNMLVSEYGVDVPTLRETREIEKQMSMELGQWTEQHDITSAGEAIPFTIVIDRTDDRDVD